MTKYRNVAVLFLMAFSLTFTTIVSAAVKITILQTSDMHGRIYPHDYALDSMDKDAGFAKIKTLVDKQRIENRNVILIDNGDTIQDNSAELFNDLAYHPMIAAMNLMQYDAWTLGNHEFNFELSFLEKNIKAFNGAVLSANIYKEGTSKRWVLPYKLFLRDGVRIAVVGMIPPAVPTWESATVSHFKGLAFKSPMQETAKVIAELEGKYDVLVGSYHIGPTGEHGYKGLEAIAEKFPQFDVLFGGHAHAKYNKEINGVKIIEPGKYGWALAKADIYVSTDGSTNKVFLVNTTNIETKNVKPNQQILDSFAYVHDKSVKDANLVVGKISEVFIDEVDYITGAAKVTTMPTSQLEDSAIIDFINEVQMYFTDADVSSAALFNFGSNLTAGDFKKKDVAYIYKYPNTLVGVNITGANLKKYMEWSASYYNTFQPGDLTVSFNGKIRGYNYDMFSGLSYDIDLSKEVGNRIVNVQLGGLDLVDYKTYKLAVNNYRFGTITKLGLVTKEDRYYDSVAKYADVPDGRIRDLIIKYTKENKQGVIKPSVDYNWQLLGVSIDRILEEKAFEMVRNGTLKIPTSADGRTLNIKSITVADVQ
ncbi:MAG: bifunctional metallophosphatase/5'-nucleotidase [Deltaproteobacteria bacterium]|nr:bifunctional metallophosphatase/5'-nucleotidase [Deltaproteobacteria bacterium]